MDAINLFGLMKSYQQIGQYLHTFGNHYLTCNTPIISICAQSYFDAMENSDVKLNIEINKAIFNYIAYYNEWFNNGNILTKFNKNICINDIIDIYLDLFGFLLSIGVAYYEYLLSNIFLI